MIMKEVMVIMTTMIKLMMRCWGGSDDDNDDNDDDDNDDDKWIECCMYSTCLDNDMFPLRPPPRPHSTTPSSLVKMSRSDSCSNCTTSFASSAVT
jgi:hypothetical protein